MKIQQKTRFDARLTKEQKEMFEYAANLGGFRTLTEFIISSAQEKAGYILKEHETIVASKRDAEIFFKALIHPPKPNKTLQTAAIKYKKRQKL